MCHRIVVYRNPSVYILGNDCQRLGKLLQDKFPVDPWASGSPQSKSDFNPSILMIKFSTIAFRTLPLSIQVHHSIFMHLQLCCMCMHAYLYSFASTAFIFFIAQHTGHASNPLPNSSFSTQLWLIHQLICPLLACSLLFMHNLDFSIIYIIIYEWHMLHIHTRHFSDILQVCNHISHPI